MNRRASLGPTKTVAFTALAVVLFFGLLEGAVRILVGPEALEYRFPSINPQRHDDKGYIQDPDLFWRLRPGGNASRFEAANPQGFRGPSLPFERRPGSFRVVCLGDSCTYAGRHPYRVAYPGGLQERLAGRNPDRIIEVMDAGVPGYTSLQALRHLKRDLIRYRPDVVTFYLAANDWNDAVFFPDRAQTPRRNTPGFGHHILRWFRTYDVACSVLLYRRREPRVNLTDYRANVEDLIAVCRREAALPVLFTYPDTFTPNRFEAYNRIVHEVATARGVPLLDFAARFKPLGRSYFLPEDFHPNMKGHLQIADWLTDFLCEHAPGLHCAPAGR